MHTGNKFLLNCVYSLELATIHYEFLPILYFLSEYLISSELLDIAFSQTPPLFSFWKELYIKTANQFFHNDNCKKFLLNKLHYQQHHSEPFSLSKNLTRYIPNFFRKRLKSKTILNPNPSLRRVRSRSRTTQTAATITRSILEE